MNLERAILRDAERSCWLVFEDPQAMFVATALEDVIPALEAAEQKLENDGGFLVGFVSFDAAPAMDRSFRARRDPHLPLVAFAHFENALQTSELPGSPLENDHDSGWALNVDETTYAEAIERIHAEIAAGNTYQINYTVRYRSENPPGAHDLFAGLGVNATYGALLEFDSHSIVSASPELFFRLDGETMVLKPMKGTAMRGLSRVDDLQRRDELASSEKDRAENVMIADMVRNDLGRIARPGSVRASDLCTVEQHPTVWQMTSTVEGETEAGMTDIFRALFPSASITGAPKSSSLSLIHRLESSARGLYTGAIGYFAADRKAQFNVAIRTATFDRARGTAEYGVGSGIIWDSVAADEFRECELKARILQRQHQHPDFSLLETLRWTREDGIALLDGHLDRLAQSAAYFDRKLNIDDVRSAIETTLATAGDDGLRLRVLVDRWGNVRVETSALPLPARDFRVRLAPRPVDSNDVFLYHKTTHRDVYVEATSGVDDCDDVLLWNEDGYITETTITNVFVRRDGKLITPPVSCGLLGGVMRAHLLNSREAEEGLIHKNCIKPGDSLLLANAVRGQFAARVVA